MQLIIKLGPPLRAIRRRTTLLKQTGLFLNEFDILGLHMSDEWGCPWPSSVERHVDSTTDPASQQA